MPDPQRSEGVGNHHGRIRQDPELDELLTEPAHAHPEPDDKADFVALVRAMTAELLDFTAARTGEQDAHDVVADVFVVTWRRWSTLPASPADRRAWVYETTKRTIRSTLRRRAREAGLLTRLRPARGEAASGSDEQVVSRSRVEQALRRLPPDQAAVLRCTLLDDLSPAQTAERLGISLTAVSSRLHRARTALVRELQTWEEDDRDDT